MKKAIETTFVVRSVGPRLSSRRGDPYVECKTDLGTVAIWGGDRNQANIDSVQSASTPYTLTTDCIAPSEAYAGRHVLWVPQTSKVRFAESLFAESPLVAKQPSSNEREVAFAGALPAIAAFRKAYGRDVTPDFIAELYVARELDLKLPTRRNEPGADAHDSTGRRYQVKCRSKGTLNIDVNNFDFDFIILVNLDDDYGLAGLWRMDQEGARSIFVHRPAYRKWQTTQARFKSSAERIR